MCNSTRNSSIQPEDSVLQLSLDNKVKISLLSGRNFWETTAIPEHNVPAIKVSDGPNGVRGEAFHNGPTGACFPASVCLAATWDTDLAKRVGNALAEEARSKGVSVLLGPTVCPHRSPLGGRNFESFSEDPFLTGKVAAAYIIGLQEKGIGATIKHFAANEQETKRATIDVKVGEKALREIYLKPFEIAIKEADPWAVMTSYNKVNGTHTDSNKWLLSTVLREQWGWNGLVMSDWGGTNSVAGSINAGMNLEMPGPGRLRSVDAVKSCLENGSILESTIDNHITTILKFLAKANASSKQQTRQERSVDRPEHRRLIREAGGQGIVLLKNQNVLPLNIANLKTVAVLGLADMCLAHGGGSATVNPHYKITPLEALRRELGDVVEISYSEGTQIRRVLPVMAEGLHDLDSKQGLTLSRFTSRDVKREPSSHSNCATAATPLMLRDPSLAMSLEGTYTARETGSHYLSLQSLGPTKVYLDDNLVFDVQESYDDALAYLMRSRPGVLGRYNFVQGQKYRIRCESKAPSSLGSQGPLALLAGKPGMWISFLTQQIVEQDLLCDAVTKAEHADLALIFVGRTAEWESEGQDMDDMKLPANGSQDRLIEAVCAVNPSVVVINSTGGPIEMPWLNKVKAVIQVWFGGQESGNSIVDVLLGTVNPGGKLPMSFPKTLQDSPSYANFPGDLSKLEVDYGEDVFTGYRYFDKSPLGLQFPFGFGLSYTTFEMDVIDVDSASLVPEGKITLQIRVRNTGSRYGSEVVQLYVQKTRCPKEEALKQLSAFKKVNLKPNEQRAVEMSIDQGSAARWDSSEGCWSMDKGLYEIVLATSSAHTSAVINFTVKETYRFGPGNRINARHSCL